MENLPIQSSEIRCIALEEGLRAGISLDNLRLAMLNQAVDWLVQMTGLPKMEVRQQLAANRGGQVAKNLATINAVRSLLKDERQPKQ
jgi:hypothetical protein